MVKNQTIKKLRSRSHWHRLTKTLFFLMKNQNCKQTSSGPLFFRHVLRPFFLVSPSLFQHQHSMCITLYVHQQNQYARLYVYMIRVTPVWNIYVLDEGMSFCLWSLDFGPWVFSIYDFYGSFFGHLLSESAVSGDFCRFFFFLVTACCSFERSNGFRARARRIIIDTGGV